VVPPGGVGSQDHTVPLPFLENKLTARPGTLSHATRRGTPVATPSLPPRVTARARPDRTAWFPRSCSILRARLSSTELLLARSPRASRPVLDMADVAPVHQYGNIVLGGKTSGVRAHGAGGRGREGGELVLTGAHDSYRSPDS